MPETDPYEQLAAELREAEEQAEKARKVQAALDKKTVQGMDDDRTATAVANGSGRIVGLTIEESALKYPERLGARVTVAIMRARKTAQALTEKAYAKYLPDLPSPVALTAIETPLKGATDYHAIDYDGPAEVKSVIAERVEALHRLEETRVAFKQRRVRQDLSSQTGVVEINVADSYLKIEIRPDAPKTLGLQRLAEQIIAGLAQAEARASEIRVQALDAIQLNGRSLGKRLRSPGTQ